MPRGAFRLNSLAKFTAVSVSRTAKTVTANGNAQVSTAQNKFGGASALFDGTGDYLSVSTSTDFGFGTGDFTIEGWFYKTSATSQYIFDTRTTTPQVSVAVQSQSNGTIRLLVNGSFVVTSSNSHTNNAWNHLAISRASGVTRLFINGVVSTNTYTDTNNYGSTKPLFIGAQFNGTTAYIGYIDDFRVSNTARYTTTFTPSTTAFVNDANTVLLLHMNGTNASTSFPDDAGVRSQNGISAFGNAQISTAQSKFGSASALFDGTGDRLNVANNDLLYWNTQPYTVEYWCRVTAFAASQPFDDPTVTGNMDPASDADYWSFGPDNSGNLTFKYYNGASVTVKDTDTMSLDTWYHCAAVITSNTIKIYLDGVEKASAAISGTPQFGTGYGGLNIGWGRSTSGRSYNGYLDEIRISNSARYTSGFTAPTAAFTNDGNTVLLIHANGTNGSQTFTDDNA